MTPKEIEARIREDISSFGAFLMPATVTIEFPEYYDYLWETLILSLVALAKGEKDIYRYAVGLPRGFAKTTFFKLFIAFCVLYGLRKFVLIVCSTESRAKDFLRDVDLLLSSDQVRQVYLDWEDAKLTNNVDCKEFNVDNEYGVLLAYGAGTAVRGLNKFNMRPDLVVLDDAQTRENAESEAARDALDDWFFGTLMKAMQRNNIMYVYVGNMYNRWCILYKLKKSEHWISLITGSILRDNESVWPEYKSVESILDEFKHDSSVGKGSLFFAECQNIVEEEGVSGLLKNARWEIKEVKEYEEFDGGFIIIDPAANKKESDANSIGAYTVRDDIVYVRELIAGNFTPDETIDAALKLCLKYKLGCIGVEAVAYQSTLGFWLEKAIQKYGLYNISVVELMPKRRNKNTRIVTWLKAMFDGFAEITSAECLAMIEWEARQFRIEKSNNIDDILDNCAYSPDMIADYRHEWAQIVYDVEGEILFDGAFIENSDPTDNRIPWR